MRGWPIPQLPPPWGLWGLVLRVTAPARWPSPHRLLSLQVTVGVSTEPTIISPRGRLWLPDTLSSCGKQTFHNRFLKHPIGACLPPVATPMGAVFISAGSGPAWQERDLICGPQHSAYGRVPCPLPMPRWGRVSATPLSVQAGWHVPREKLEAEGLATGLTFRASLPTRQVHLRHPQLAWRTESHACDRAHGCGVKPTISPRPAKSVRSVEVP